MKPELNNKVPIKIPVKFKCQAKCDVIDNEPESVGIS
jgi:hypothetical protein